MTSCYEKTEARHRRALIKARFFIDDAYRLLATLDGTDLAVHVCPVCGGADISKSDIHFLCGVKTDPRSACTADSISARACGAQGDVVTLIMAARDIGAGAAMEIIETHLSGGRHE